MMETTSRELKEFQEEEIRVTPGARLATMREMFLYGSGICSWRIGRDGSLQYSNCKSAAFFHDLYSISYCCDAISGHFKEQDAPCIASDRLGFVWIAAAETSQDRSGALHLLGPIFTLDASESYLRQSCRRLKLSDALTDELLRQLSIVPTIPFAAALSYAVMLHYGVNGERIEQKKAGFYCEAASPEERSQWAETNWHGTWEREQEMFGKIRDGKKVSLTEFSAPFAEGTVGTLSPDNPLMQAKYEIVVFTALAARAAIMGGLSPEGGYNLADYYIQRVDACSSISDVYNCAQEMFDMLLERVQRCRKNLQYSPPVSACLDYIETHICDKIALEDMARSIGYTGYYLSSKFQKELGMSVNTYINRRKIELARTYLTTTGFTAAEISERLSFSSPSYFSSVFRKETGMSPKEYAAKGRAGAPMQEEMSDSGE